MTPADRWVERTPRDSLLALAARPGAPPELRAFAQMDPFDVTRRFHEQDRAGVALLFDLVRFTVRCKDAETRRAVKLVLGQLTAEMQALAPHFKTLLEKDDEARTRGIRHIFAKTPPAIPTSVAEDSPGEERLVGRDGTDDTSGLAMDPFEYPADERSHFLADSFLLLEEGDHAIWVRARCRACLNRTEVTGCSSGCDLRAGDCGPRHFGMEIPEAPARLTGLMTGPRGAPGGAAEAARRHEEFMEEFERTVARDGLPSRGALKREGHSGERAGEILREYRRRHPSK